MPRRLVITWPDSRLFASRGGEPFRILAVSDQLDPTLADARTRQDLGRIDLVLGCGDMRAADLGFIADAVAAPLLFVRGNHDGDASWHHAAMHLPEPLEKTAAVRSDGITFVPLPWPGDKGRAATRNERSAWRQAISAELRMLTRRGPFIVISHVPPLGLGDVATDAYHRGFPAYRWLLRRLHPTLWLHGHTPLAAVSDWQRCEGSTTCVNVTGAVLIELRAPGTATEDAPGTEAL